MRVGIGYDVHKLVKNRKLILGGVTIPHTLGLLGHSDADVLVHAIMDSILGAMAKGDIGVNFPDTSSDFKDISSINLLEMVYEIMIKDGYIVGNIDAVIVAQKPKVSKYINEMRKIISDALHTDINNISIKATTEEELGFTGNEEGISSKAICLLLKNS